MKSKDDLIYELIFSKNNEFEIDISDYIEKIYRYDDFIDDIKKVLFKSKVMIVSDEIDILNNKKVRIIWRLKVKK